MFGVTSASLFLCGRSWCMSRYCKGHDLARSEVHRWFSCFGGAVIRRVMDLFITFRTSFQRFWKSMLSELYRCFLLSCACFTVCARTALDTRIVFCHLPIFVPLPSLLLILRNSQLLWKGQVFKLQIIVRSGLVLLRVSVMLLGKMFFSSISFQGLQ